MDYVYENALQSGATSIVIATDDEKIAQIAEDFGSNVCMTESAHVSGTERIAEAVATMALDENDIVVCLQADEPLMPPKLIFQLAENLSEHDHVKVATVARKLLTSEDLFNPNVVKVVLNHRNYAMNFSRAPIPWDREQFSNCQTLDISKIKLADAYYHHIGMYAYRAGFLDTYVNWTPSLNETLESLEQLRILYNGYKILVCITDLPVPAGVDTAADMERVRSQF
ncbi:MAG: 3-deoxy-manno-octulosonate cytidylyltransferase [Gammaproteobacteria bacterium]|nr:3-deoxy-manno-octulosonate cytidylyltransferase [Gammaproteobacteria bacterium]